MLEDFEGFQANGTFSEWKLLPDRTAIGYRCVSTMMSICLTKSGKAEPNSLDGGESQSHSDFSIVNDACEVRC